MNKDTDQKTFEELGELIWTNPDSLTDEDLERYLTIYHQMEEGQYESDHLYPHLHHM
jgi:hypothetical protein